MLKSFKGHLPLQKKLNTSFFKKVAEDGFRGGLLGLFGAAISAVVVLIKKKTSKGARVVSSSNSPTPNDDLGEQPEDIYLPKHEIVFNERSETVKNAEKEASPQTIDTNPSDKRIGTLYCYKCGAKLLEGSLFCSKCGTKVWAGDKE